MGDFNFWLPLLLSIPLAIAANLATGPVQRLFDAWSGRAPQRRISRLRKRVQRARFSADNERVALGRVIICGFAHLSLLTMGFGTNDFANTSRVTNSEMTISLFNAAVEVGKVAFWLSSAMSIISISIATAVLLLLFRYMSSYMDIDVLPKLEKSLEDQLAQIEMGATESR